MHGLRVGFRCKWSLESLKKSKNELSVESVQSWRKVLTIPDELELTELKTHSIAKGFILKRVCQVPKIRMLAKKTKL